MSSSSPPPKPIILVVEDEPFLRLHAVDAIEESGFEAIEAADADEACRILEARADIRIVFTDIDMPGSIDGLKLAAFIRKRWPPIAVIITSGHVRPSIDDMPARSRFFAKPYQADQLLGAIRAFLRAG